MPTDIAVTGMISAAWLAPMHNDVGPTSATNDIRSISTPLEFDFLETAGPSWPADEAASSSEFLDVNASNGVLVQYPLTNITVDGVTGTIKEGGSAGGASHMIRFRILEWGKTLAAALPALQGKMVVACIPIGENITTAENGFFYLAGKLSSAIEYNTGGDSIVGIDVEISGTAWTVDSSDTATYDAAVLANVVTGTTVFTGITPVGKSVAVVPTPLTAGADMTRLKAGLIVVK